jgi:gamma-glutamylputrescine oxidase
MRVGRRKEITMWVGHKQKRADACDVVVVGAGLVGAAVAARLAREEFDTAVLEAQRVAGGATGRSAGMVLTGLAGHYNWAISAYGRQKAREVWALTVEGRERLVETAERMAVPVEHTGSLALAVEDAEAEALEESATLLQEDGFDVQFDPSDPLDRGFRAALRHPDDVTVDVAALTQALLTASDVTIHEGTEVYNVEPDQNRVRVWAQGRTVLCNAVALAINGYAPLFDLYFTDKIAPTRSLIVATEPLDGVALEQPCYTDYGYEYCRQLPDGRLLLGGWRRSRPASQGTGQEAEPDDAVQDELIRFASRHFPEVETHSVSRWSGVTGFTPDGLPLVGRLPDLPQVYFTVGFGGRGLAWAFVAAEQLVALMLHDTGPGILSAARLG